MRALRGSVLLPAWVVLLTALSLVGGSGLWTALFIVRGCAL